MTISEIYNLEKSQAELDFVDIDINKDTPLFLDPYFLSKRSDKFSVDARRTLQSFFQELVDNIRNNTYEEAKNLFLHLKEPNSTCLGLSRSNPKGRGVGDKDTLKIFRRLIKSKAIQTGLIQDVEDNILFVEKFGKDKLSDMTTNIITGHLIKYTQDQCRLHNIPLTEGISSGYYWDILTREWSVKYTEMLVIDDRSIILIPKGIVSLCKAYIPEKYYQHYILNFLQHEELSLNSALVEFRADKKTKFITKKKLKEKYPKSKEFLREFTKNHPEVLQEFKLNVEIESLKDNDFTNINIRDVTTNLVSILKNIPSGSTSANDFHNKVIGILELLFYPHLINPVKERDIHEGRKRVDITFDNAAKVGIFKRLSDNHKIPCQYIFVECKNYSSDIKNPELDQLGGRFSVNKGQVGFLVCREIENMTLFMNRCRDTYKDNRGLIIPLVDKDLINLLENYCKMDDDYIEHFLSDRIRDIIMG